MMISVVEPVVGSVLIVVVVPIDVLAVELLLTSVVAFDETEHIDTPNLTFFAGLLSLVSSVTVTVEPAGMGRFPGISTVVLPSGDVPVKMILPSGPRMVTVTLLTFVFPGGTPTDVRYVSFGILNSIFSSLLVKSTPCEVGFKS